MKENEQIIWNLLFSKKNYSKLFNYSAQTCAEAEDVVYYGEYYSFVFLEKSMAYDSQ
jgi:hypothetical protein